MTHMLQAGATHPIPRPGIGHATADSPDSRALGDLLAEAYWLVVDGALPSLHYQLSRSGDDRAADTTRAWHLCIWAVD